MKIGLVGLGKMGYALALNMKDSGIAVGVTNRTYDKVQAIEKEGVKGYQTLDELLDAFEDKRRVVWLMLPAGEIVEAYIEELSEKLNPGDILIDGGNSNYLDTQRRYERLKPKGIHFVDVGTSGGVEGARNGACLMVGGDQEAVNWIGDDLEKLAVPNGYGYFGQSGSGHYVKMIHNAIEYGMMQAIGEGFDLMQASEYDIDFAQAAKVWSHGSIIEGLLMRLMHQAFEKDGQLENILPRVDASGEADWAVQEALRLKVSAPVIVQSLLVRYKSKDEEGFSEKAVAALRHEFGGHKLYKK